MEHRFNVQFAKDYGIEEAVMIDNLYYWIAKNVANEKHKHDGRYWTYNSVNAFSKLFPYMNEKKIYRVLKNLENLKFIVIGNYFESKYNRTSWYSFSDMALGILCAQGYDIKNFSETFQNVQMHFSKMENGNSENGKCNNIYNNTDIKNTYSKQEEGIIIPSKKIDFQAIVDCWNKYNGKRLGEVKKLTTKRKGAMKRLMEEHSLTLEQLMRLLSTIPYADNWLYNPTREHKDWKPDFDWWMANTKGWFTKLVEGNVHTQNKSIFQSVMNGETLESAYTPMTSIELRWNEIHNCYIFTGMFWNDIYDGYTKENRPDGARIMLNNGRGYIHWSSEFKEWLKD